jgi:hypothetical protein
MKYLLMIYGNEAADAARPEAELQAEMGEYFAYTQEVEKAGALRGGEALHPSSTATVVRLRNGKVTTTDGPFAETKEQLGGYYLVEAKNLDEAIQWAAKIPHAKIGAIEVRPVMDFSKEAGA